MRGPNEKEGTQNSKGGHEKKGNKAKATATKIFNKFYK